MAPVLTMKGRFALGAAASLLIATGLGLSSCSGKVTSAPIGFVSGGPAIPLTAAEVQTIIFRALNSIDAADMHIAVTDRTGGILGIYSTNPAQFEDGDHIAVSLARTTSFFSNSQAPLSSRTVETLGAFHFPPTFDEPFVPSVATTGGSPSVASVIAPTRTTTGVAGTPQGPLWQINATNRGAVIADGGQTSFNIGQDAFRPSRNANDATLPADETAVASPGITLLPGGIPLFKPNAAGVPRLVGGVGVYVPRTGTQDPDVAAGEFAAIVGAGFGATNTFGDEKFFFDAIPLEGAITIVGVLLPYVRQTTRPALYAPRAPGVVGGYLPAFPTQVLPGPRTGTPDPFGFLIGPLDGQLPAPIDDNTGGLTQNNVQRIIDQVVASADITRAQVRLPLGSSARVIATIVDTRGRILAHFRMEDTLCDAVDVVPAKARSVVYYCLPSADPRSAFANGDAWPGFPTGDVRGIALTTRTLGFLSQPFYPPGIDSTAPGPLFALAQQNQLPTQLQRWGNSAPDFPFQNGLTFFPGSVPLYKPDINGVPQLVGALGVSGDGVEQNDLIAADGGRGFEPPPELRIDNFEFDGVKLPYLKFPQTPR
ncbi:MAG: heme-binding protein [Planctomycetota bacterium]